MQKNLILETYNGSFKVPISWLSIQVRDIFDMNLWQFRDAYTYDDAELIRERAILEGLVS